MGRGLVLALLAFSVAAVILLVFSIAPSSAVSIPLPVKPKPLEAGGVESGAVGRMITGEEARRALEIVSGSERIRGLIGNVGWKPLEEVLYNQIVYGSEVTVVILLSEPVWVEIEEYPAKPRGRAVAKMWTESMQVVVDLEKGEVTRIHPGVGRAERDPVLRDDREVEKVQRAKEIALGYEPVKQLKPSKRIVLLAIYYTGEYPEGAAFFRVFDNELEVLVGVDLAGMRILQERSGGPIRYRGD
ncbi:MAG: hypothetical protein QXU72_03735 [Thermofilum sp.]